MVWPYEKVDPYDLFQLLRVNPRITGAEVSRISKVYRTTGEKWLNAAFENLIISYPMFRRKSFLNFRDYFYFVKVTNPLESYERIKKMENISYCSVQAGPFNLQIVSSEKIDPPGDIVLSGPRSDYFVSVPPNCTFRMSFQNILEKLENIDTYEETPSPLVYHDEVFPNWDSGMETIYRELRMDMRKPFKYLVVKKGVYSDKIMEWLKNRDQFGSTIVMFYPEGLKSYEETKFYVQTDHDSILIDLFSTLPTSSTFYRVDNVLVMKVALPFSAENRKIVDESLTKLMEKGIVHEYTYTIDRYYYRVD